MRFGTYAPPFPSFAQPPCTSTAQGPGGGRRPRGPANGERVSRQGALCEAERKAMKETTSPLTSRLTWRPAPGASSRGSRGRPGGSALAPRESMRLRTYVPYYIATSRLRLLDGSKPEDSARVTPRCKLQAPGAVAHEALEAILGPNQHGGSRHLFDRAELLNRHS